MSYQVIARKWRPQSFQELIGQEHVSQSLLNALRSGRIPHALLFTGTRGVGKTSSARILAKSIRCPNATDFVPCNKCDICNEVQTGHSLDVIEIDGASNNGVDAIRELRDSVGYMPAKGKYKIYIIDEVHMLSNSAFNALLKTLEEPPAHVIFILATTEAQKIPATVLSRVQRFDFRRIPARTIYQHLQHICREEKITSDKDSLWFIAKHADGSMRDSLSLLDLAISYSGTTLDKDKITSILGITDRSLLLDALTAIVKKDRAQIFQVLERILSSVNEPKNFMNYFLEEIRNLLFVKIQPHNLADVVDLPDSELEDLQNLASLLGEEELHMLFDMALKGAGDLTRASEPRIVLEMIFLRMLSAPSIRNLNQILGGSVAVTTTTATTSAPPTPAKTPMAKAQVTAPAAPVPAVQTAPTAPQPAPEVKKETSTYLKNKTLLENWTLFVRNTQQYDSLTAAKLEHASPLQFENHKLVLGFAPQHEFLMQQLSEGPSKKRLEEKLSQFWDQNVIIDARTMSLEASDTAISPKAKEELDKKLADQKMLEAIQEDPLVQAAQKTFKAKIQNIKEIK